MAIESTLGIVLQQIKYGDTSIICQIYTEEFGRKSFLFKGIRSKKSKLHPNILQSLSIINIEAYIKSGRDISLVKEASSATIFIHFPYDVKKSTQAMFLAEVLSKCLKEEVSNRPLFSFIKNSVEYFDLVESGSANFHIYFLLKLSKHLGFLPSAKMNRDELVFDMKEGIYKDHLPDHLDFIDELNSELLNEILNKNYNQLSGIELNQTRRNELLNYILRFYSLHIDGVSTLRSLEILKEIFI